MTARQLICIVLLVASGVQGAAPLAAAARDGARHASHDGAAHGMEDHDSGGTPHHHPGCPWRAASVPCPHAASNTGPALASCADAAPAAFGAASSAALVEPSSSWVPPRATHISWTAPEERRIPDAGPRHDPPPPKEPSVR